MILKKSKFELLTPPPESGGGGGGGGALRAKYLLPYCAFVMPFNLIRDAI